MAGIDNAPRIIKFTRSQRKERHTIVINQWTQFLSTRPRNKSSNAWIPELTVIILQYTKILEPKLINLENLGNFLWSFKVQQRFLPKIWEKSCKGRVEIIDGTRILDLLFFSAIAFVTQMMAYASQSKAKIYGVENPLIGFAIDRPKIREELIFVKDWIVEHKIKVGKCVLRKGEFDSVFPAWVLEASEYEWD